MTADDVELTDLEVIQQFSLAVRGATASRAAVVAALEADLAYLTTGRRAAATSAAAGTALERKAARAAASRAAASGAAAAKAPAAAAARRTKG